MSKCDVNLEQTYTLWLSHNCPPKGKRQGWDTGGTHNKKTKQAKKSSHLSTLFHRHQRTLQEQGGMCDFQQRRASTDSGPSMQFQWQSPYLPFPSHDFYGELILCVLPVKTIDSRRALAPISAGPAQNTVLITAMYRCTCEIYSCRQTQLYFRSLSPDLSLQS